MKATIKDGKLIVELALQEKATPSTSGKTIVIASSHGNQPTGAVYEGKPVILGLNAYVRKA